MSQLSDAALRKLFLALSIYIVSLFAANTLGLKIMPLPFGLHLSVGAFMFPVVFVMTDVIGEVYGPAIARLFVLGGFVSTALFTGYSFLSLSLPWAPAGEWVHASYNTVFGLTARIAIASLVAFIVGEYQDVVAFFFFRKRLNGRHFWLRSNLSNVWSQLLDTVLFMSIAFYGVYANADLVRLMLTWWLFKVAMGVLYTPLAYAAIRLLRGATPP